MDELDETVLDIAQRQKRAMIMRRNKVKIERAREIAKKKMAPESKLRKRAFIKARQIIRKKVAGQRGADYEKLGPSEKMAIDRAVEGKQKLIKKLAMRLVPRIKQAESKRLQAFMQGHSIENQGQPEGKTAVKEHIDRLFTEAFPATAGAMGQIGDAKITGSGKRMPPKGKSKNEVITQHNKFDEEVEHNTAAFASLCKKSEKSGIDLEILGEVYNRGWNTWTEDCRVSQQQYAFARVNSYINQGKSYFNEDADLHELSPMTLDSYAKKSSKQATGLVRKIGDINRKKYTGRANYQPIKKLSPEDEAEKSSARAELRKRVQGQALAVKKLKAMGEDKEDADLHETDISKYNIRIARDKPKKAPGKTFMDVLDHVDVPAKHIERARGVWNRTKDINAVKKFVSSVSEETHIDEARAPGRAYVKPYLHPSTGEHIGWKSATKWGKTQYWQKTDRGLAKAKAHAGVDKIDEEVQHPNENFTDAAAQSDTVNENLRKWFKDRWVRMNTKGEIQGDCAREPGEGKPKCLPASKAHAMSPADRAKAARRKRREDPVADRKGKGHKPIMVATEGYIEEKAKPTDSALWSRAKSLAKSKFDVYPSAYANGWAAKWYKTKGGKWTNISEEQRPNPTFVEGTNCRNCVFWREDLEKPVTKGELNTNGGLKAPNEEYIKMSKEVDLGTLPGKASVKVKGFCDNDKVKDWVTERMCCALWDSDKMIRDYKGESPVFEQNGEERLKIKASLRDVLTNRKHVQHVERDASPNTRDQDSDDPTSAQSSHSRQQQIKKKIIDEAGNSELNPAKRLMGTDSLVKAYKKDTPGENKKLDESFNIAFASGVGVTLTAKDLGMEIQGGFALHPSVVAEQEVVHDKCGTPECCGQCGVDEAVKTADIKAEVVPSHNRTVIDPATGAQKQVVVPGHVRRAKQNRTIIGSGNVNDGEPPK
jgi:hypothetical protein